MKRTYCFNFSFWDKVAEIRHRCSFDRAITRLVNSAFMTLTVQANYMNSAQVGNYYAYPNTGEIRELISISNNQYDLQVNSQVWRLSQSQFNQLIQIPDPIFHLLKHPDEKYLATHKQLIDSFLKEVMDFYLGDEKNIKYEVLEAWRKKLGFYLSNGMLSVTNYDKSLEYGGLYMGGDWRDDYDPLY